MKRVLSPLLVVSLIAVIAAPLFAQDQAQKKAKRKKQAQQAGQGAVIPAGLARQLEQANLTDKQKKQIEEIKTKYAGKVNQARQAVNSVLTREQRQARREAMIKARQDGKRGAELRAAVDAAVQLTDEQKKSLADAEAQMRQLQTEVRQAVLAVLTDEQKKAVGLDQPQKKAKKKRKKAA